jgi:hypothetical protein
MEPKAATLFAAILVVSKSPFSERAVAVAHPLCFSVCNAVVQDAECQALAAAGFYPMPDCTEIDPKTGNPTFPVESSMLLFFFFF